MVQFPLKSRSLVTNLPETEPSPNQGKSNEDDTHFTEKINFIVEKCLITPLR